MYHIVIKIQTCGLESENVLKEMCASEEIREVNVICLTNTKGAVRVKNLGLWRWPGPRQRSEGLDLWDG